jgi:hypothetical protein
MSDQSVSDYIDSILEQKLDDYILVWPQEVPSSPLKNYRVGHYEYNKIAHVTADIYPRDLDSDNDSNLSDIAVKRANANGYGCDEPDLIIPKEFGGSGKPENVYPRSKFVCFSRRFSFISVIFQMDTVTLNNDILEVRKHLETNQPDRYAQLTFGFEYNDIAHKINRPRYFYYRFRLYENENVIKELSNKLLNTCRRSENDFK